MAFWEVDPLFPLSFLLSGFWLFPGFHFMGGWVVVAPVPGHCLLVAFISIQ